MTKAERSEAAKKAWKTIRANKAAGKKSEKPKKSEKKAATRIRDAKGHFAPKEAMPTAN